jgi:hypothetical protein
MVQFSFMNVLIHTHNQTHKYYPWFNVGKRNQIQYAKTMHLAIRLDLNID